MKGSHCPSTRLGGLRVRPKVYLLWAVLLRLLAVLPALKRLELQRQMEGGAERPRFAPRWIWRGTTMRMRKLVASNHLHPVSVRISMERMRQLLREPKQHLASTRRIAATRSRRKMTMTLSGPPHPWKCSAHPVTAAQSVSTPSKTTTTSAALLVATHSTEPASTHGSRAAAPAAHSAKPTTTSPSLDQKAKTRTPLDVATVAREATCPKRHNQHGWAPAAFPSAHASLAPEVSSSALPRPKTQRNRHITLHHTAPSADGASRTPVPPPNQRQKLPSPAATAAGEADSRACHSADERNPLTVVPTVCQKSSARLLAIWKPDVLHSDDITSFGTLSDIYNTTIRLG